MSQQELENVKLSTVVTAIDGDAIYNGCGLGLKNCREEKPCPAHSQFKIIRDQLKIMLETNLIKDLTMDFKEGLTFLKRE